MTEVGILEHHVSLLWRILRVMSDGFLLSTIHIMRDVATHSEYLDVVSAEWRYPKS